MGTHEGEPKAFLGGVSTMLEHEALTGAIIGSAIEVHRSLGPGFLEALYEEALTLELGDRGIPFERQLPVPVLYRNVQVGTHRLDLFVAGQIVVEIKSVREILDVHFAVAKSYLRAVDRQHGLILNFSKPTLEVKRVLARE